MSDVPSAGLPAPRLVVIGASAGGLAPLRTIAAALPADLPATVLVVMHLSSTGNSVLPQILARVARLGVTPAMDDLEIRPGRILVAPPDRHLTVLDSHVCLSRGPRENGHRPAVDPLFRTAAEQYGSAVVGVILSGSRDDGALGLAEIKARGGITIVQEPSEAQYDGMPAHALAGTDVDLVLPAAEIGRALVRLVRGEQEVRSRHVEHPDDADPQMLSVLCPECGGTLFEDREGGVLQYRCHVGHRYAARSLLASHAESVERGMWTAVRLLEDRATLLRRLADRAERSGGTLSAQHFRATADNAEQQAGAIRVAIEGLDVAIEPVAASGGEAA